METKFPKKLVLLLVGIVLLVFWAGRLILSKARNIPLESHSNSAASLLLLGTQEEKIGICHYVGSKKKAYDFIEVPPAAATEHQAHHNDKIGVKSAGDCPKESTDSTSIVTQPPEDGGETPAPTKPELTSTSKHPPTVEPSQPPETDPAATSNPTDPSIPDSTNTAENSPTSITTQTTHIPDPQPSENGQPTNSKVTQAIPATPKTKEPGPNSTETSSEPTPDSNEEPITDLRLTLHETEAQLKEAREQGAALNQRLHETKENLEKAEHELNKANGDKDQLQQKFTALKEEFDKLVLDKAVNDQQVKDLEKTVSILQVAIDNNDAVDVEAYWTKVAAIVAIVLGTMAIICSSIVTVWGEDIRAYFKKRGEKEIPNPAEESSAD